MLCRGEQLLVVVLAVHVDEVRRDGFEDRGGGGPAVDAAGRFPVRRDLPADEHAVLLGRVTRLPERGGRRWRKPGEKGGDDRLFLPRADDLLGGALPQHGVDGADQDRFPRARLAGKDVEAAGKIDRRLADHRDILYVEL